MDKINRRQIIRYGALVPLALTASACTTTSEETDDDRELQAAPKRLPFGSEPDFPPFEEMYAARRDGGFNLPAIPYQRVPERYRRQVVKDPTREAAGTIVVDTRKHYLYLVLGNGRAIRYGVGLGRAGFEWSGRAEVRRRAKWPKWHPPAEMIEREPKLERYRTFYDAATNTYSGGMEPGLLNPLGARALYIYQNGKDTLYRLHGSPEWNSIGKSVSSGCVRLMNQDVIDLYNRVKGRAPILVR